MDLIGNHKIIGILGGMGPEATKYLFNLIVENTPAQKDQDHTPVIIFSNPKTPDRTQYIVYGEESPLPYLTEGIKVLNKCKVSIITIACNASHFFYDCLSHHSEAPILHMIKLTAQILKRKLGNEESVGILATTGTIKSQLYQKELSRLGIKSYTLSDSDQSHLVMKAIYGSEGIKRGFKREPKELLIRASNKLRKMGAEYIIMGCSEIPLVLSGQYNDIIFIDPLLILAQEAIRLCK
jgi:aspartate racemase